MQKNLSLLILFLTGLVYSSCSFAQAQTEETLTITTYYPAPYGVYNEMRLFPHTPAGSCDSTKIGTMYYDSAPNENQIKVCTDDGWKNIGGDPAGKTLADFGNAAMYLSDGATISGSCSSQGQEIRITGSARYLNNKIQTRAYGDKVGIYKCDSGWIDGYSAECSTLQIVERVSARINTNINGVSGNSNSLGPGCTMLSQDDGHCIGQSYDMSCSFPTVSW